MQTKTEYVAQWRKENPEKVTAQHKRANDKKRRDGYYIKNKDRIKDQYLTRLYGITLKEFNEILLEQDNQCAICGADKCASGKSFAVDHDHTTGKVRGLLCKKCNMGLGHFEDNLETIKNIMKYMEKYKCRLP